MSRRNLWLLLLVMSISACATHQNMRDTAQLAQGTGVMVATVLVRSVNNVPYPHVAISFADVHSVVNTKVVALDAKDNTVVLNVPAGNYSWTNITLMDLTGSFSYRMPFTIEAGKINYVGDILILLDSYHEKEVHGRRMPSYTVFVKDLSSYTLPNAASAYPELWHAYPVVTHLTKDLRHKLRAN